MISAPLTPRLVVAGAGSGKTATMVDRVVWLVANGVVAPDQVLGVTFTRKAAHELSARISARLGTLAEALRAEGLPLPAGLERGGDDLVGQRPVVHTYNGFALDLVREHALAVGEDLLEHDHLAGGLELQRRDDVHGLVEDDLLALAQLVLVDGGTDVDAQLAATGEDIDGAVAVQLKERAEAGRRLSEPVDLFLERNDLVAGLA